MQLILSDVERLVLKALVQNSRYSPDLIGKMIGKSRNWVSRTIKGLVKSGAIRGYTTIVNPSLVQGARGTILFMKSNPRESNVSQKLMEMEELESLDGISGDFSLLGFFRYNSQGIFEDLLDRVDRVVASSGTGKYDLVQLLTAYKKNRFRIITKETPETLLSEKELELIRILYRQKPTSENPYPLTQEKIGTLMNPQLSQPAVSKAIDKLLLKRAIIGYSVDIDFGLIDLPIKFYVRIKVSPGSVSDLAMKLVENDNVWDLYRTSEDYRLLTMVRTDSISSFNKFLRELYENDNVLDSQSYISLEEWFVPFR
ncbi:Lrp/AsnC family transcriptional regulator [Candidatus Thorarchaeota archaeon]|nr:MAG: Lrp/AsnC family transcriptional regulator [Candidatus Thorarchaeota archaeon]